MRIDAIREPRIGGSCTGGAGVCSTCVSAGVGVCAVALIPSKVRPGSPTDNGISQV